MKVITKSVMRWVGDELVTVEEVSYEYSGPVAEAKGGGSSARDLTPEELEVIRLQAEGMRSQQAFERGTLYPMKERLGQEVLGYGSDQNAELAATNAGASVVASADAARRGLTDNLNSMGINPADARYVSALANVDRDAIAQQAAAMTGAREGRKERGLSMMQSYITGNPFQSYSGNAAFQGGDAMRRAAGAESQGIYNAVAGAGQLINTGMNNGWFGMADGGPVYLEDGGYVHRGIQRLANGGKAGMAYDWGSMKLPSRSSSSGPQAPTTGDYAMSGAKLALGNKPLANYARPYVDSMMEQMGMKSIGTPGTESLLQQGTAAGQQAADQAAQQAVDWAANYGTQAAGDVAANAAADAAVTAATDIAGTAAADAALATAAETAAVEGAGLLAAEAGLAATGVGAPIAAALALGTLGSELDWWADGGRVPKVRSGSMGIRGGKVSGPGGPKDDLIPAMLSDGEFVMPVGTVKKYGIEKLEKMRQAGLAFEKQMGIGRGRRA